MHPIIIKWRQDPVTGAFFIALLLALILFPYWWLADRWFRTIIFDDATRFTFSSTTFLLILAIVDCAFLVRYYQIRRKNDLAHSADLIQKGAENYRLLIEKAPFPIVITKLSDRTILEINNEAADLFSIIPSERIGKKVSERFITAMNQEKILEILSTKKQVSDFEVSFQKDNNEVVYASLSANIIDYLGEKAVFSAFVNISERVTLEKEILYREEKFSTVFHEVPNPLMILSDAGIIIEINKGCETFIGLSKDLLVNKKLEDFQFFPDIDKEFYCKAVHDSQAVETVIVLPDNRRKFVTLYTRSISIHDAPHGLLLIQDIDEIKRTQNAISQANNQLSILNSITRHDILNRVMVVISYCELLGYKVKEDPESTWIRNIVKSGEDIQALIDFTRQYQDLGINPPKWQRVEEIMKKRNIASLLSDVSVSLPDEHIEVYADPMFEKVLYNLIDNSIRHGEKVTLISLSYVNHDPDIILRYTDNGVGISTEDKKKIFKKGFGKNTGLGLFLIREILHLTGIIISEEGIPGNGVRFDMIVPAGAFRTQRGT
jgi:PAS domain S-box-containing protein